jgi:ABC-type multidrug transport system fused ATPase/permease subunit
VALARALYAERDIYLLDDPLASLDPIVAERVFSEAVWPLSRRRPVLMICNDVQMLARADMVLTVTDGSVAVHVQTSIVSAETQSKDAEHTNVQESDKYVYAQTRAAQGGSGGSWTAGLVSTLEQASAKGNVSWGVYSAYATACGRSFAVATLGLVLLVKALDVLKDYQLALATTAEVAIDETAFTKYTLVAVMVMLLVATRLSVIAAMGFRAACALHDRVLDAVLHAPLSFFQRTPAGRLQVLFSSDVAILDGSLSSTIGTWIESFLTVAAAFSLLVGMSPLALFALGPLVWVYMRVRQIYLVPYVSVKRLSQKCKAPVLSQLTQSLEGLSSIRAFGLRQQMAATNMAVTATYGNAYFSLVSCNRWLGFRLDLISALIVLTAAVLSQNPGVSGGLAGLLLTYAIQITNSLAFGIRVTAQVESEFSSVERLLEYSRVESERLTGNECPPLWPARGTVEFRNVSLKYAPELPFALADVSLTIPAGQHLGVVGRTGSGKSTLVNSLFRLVECTHGVIAVDGVDIASLRVADLRASRLALVSQEPILFAGSLRISLDPAYALVCFPSRFL